MLLYHGTWEYTYEKILEEGEIKCFGTVASDTTKIINEILNEYGTEINLREGAIFLTDDIEGVEAYDYAFVLDINKLNIDLLYVADFHYSTKLYDYVMRGIEDKNEVKQIVKKYEDSYMDFNEYLQRKEDFIFPEFLYYGDIPLDAIKVLSDNDIINIGS